MFPSVASPEHSHILVGQRPRRIVRALDHIFDLSTQNSLVTYLAGLPGSGKSHIIHHLNHLTRERRDRIFVLVNANLFSSHEEFTLDEAALLRLIYQDDNFRDFASDLQYELPEAPESNDVGELLEIINDVIHAGEADRITKDLRGESGLVLAIDGLDEYVRPISGGSVVAFDTERFALAVRFLLDMLDRTCVILGFTTAIYDEVYKVIEPDRTFLRRFITPQEFNGEPLTFDAFGLSETREMYDRYRQEWLQRASEDGLLAPRDRNGLLEGHWPFSPEAVQLAWEATDHLPRSLQQLFQRAFEELRVLGGDQWLSGREEIGLIEMAGVIEAASRQGDAGLEIHGETLASKLRILRKWNERSQRGKEVDIPALALIFADLLKAEGMETNSVTAATVGEIPLTSIQISSLGGEGKLFILMLEDVSPESLLSVLRALAGTLEWDRNVRFLVLCKPDSIDQVQEAWRESINYASDPAIFHLGNSGYILGLDSVQLKGLSTGPEEKEDPEYEAWLWVADRLCSPLKPLRLSEILTPLARSAFVGGAAIA